MSQNMNLSMTPYTQAGAFVCSQYDVGRECQITLIDDSGNYTIPTGATITVMATKPSGLGFTETCTWTGSTVTFSTTNTMTNEFGRFPAELRITQGNTILGTTNFMFKVEKSPHPNDVIDDDVIIHQNLVARVTTLEGQMATVQSDITDVKADIEELQQGGGGLTEDVKQALLDCFENVAWINEDGQTYYDALEDALYPPADLVSISAVYSGGNVYNTATLDDLKPNLVVTAHMSDSTTQTVTTYVLSGTIATGTQTITVTYGGKTTTFTITVVEWLTSISAVYTQSGTVYDTDTLDSLKADLVVTANYADSTSGMITDYTLSGTLAEGTSTITVSYGGKTASFNVTVTHVVSSEILAFTSCPTGTDEGVKFNSTTFEDVAVTGEWTVTSNIKASSLSFVWDTEEADKFQITIGQYDASGNPYKVSNLQKYSSGPMTDGSTMTWADAGNSNKYTAISGGNIQITLPTTGVVRITVRKSSGTGAASSNATFATWLEEGGLTITAHI